MSSKENRAKNLKKEFIKSGAMLLLAVVLLVTAVLAWFGDSEGVSIEPFLLSIDSEIDGVRLDEDTVANKVVILPAATKLGDPTISEADFAKVIKIVPYEVKSGKSGSVAVNLTLEEGLNCYIDTEYKASDNKELEYSDIIFEDPPVLDENNGITATFTYNDLDYDEEKKEYNRMVALVFWADYDTHIETIRSEGQVELNVLMFVRAVNEN